MSSRREFVGTADGHAIESVHVHESQRRNSNCQQGGEDNNGSTVHCELSAMSGVHV